MGSVARRAGIHVVLVAMLLRALLPQGWMPNVNSEPGVPLVICTIHGAIHLNPLSGHQHRPANDDGQHHELCPFAAASHSATPAAAVPVLLPPILTAFAPPLSRNLGTISLTAYSLSSPRAPPRLV